MFFDGSLKRPSFEVKLDFANCEHALTKGEDQYKQHVGFIDVYAKLKHYYATPKYDDDDKITFEPEYMLIEVKVKPVAVSEIVKQLNLYREFCKHHSTIAVIDWPLTPDERAMFEQANIRSVKLGDDFENWLKNRPGIDNQDECI